MATGFVLEMFKRSVSDQPAKIAIEHRNTQITYAQVEEYANRIACKLQSKGVGAGKFVGTFLKPGPELVGSILGILKTGGAFVPLDINYPDRRLEQMLTEVPLMFIITEDHDLERIHSLTSGVQRNKLENKEMESGVSILSVGNISLTMDYEQGEVELPYVAPIGESVNQPDDPAYVYFTSGSTGKPKAIVGCHRGLAHFIQWEIETFGVGDNFKVSNFTPPSHDPYLRDLFVPLCAGGTLCIPDDREMLLHAQALVDWIDSHNITLIHCVPGLFKQILGEVCQRLQEKNGTQQNQLFSALRYICLAGEKVSVHDTDHWLQIFGTRIQLVNFYGPTETTMAKLFYMIKPSEGKRGFVPIGVPMKGARAILLDENRQICPPGVMGEIYIRTPYMTLGYYNDPEKTRSVFLPNPFSNNPADLIFKTGDLGRLLADGNIEFCGRVDHQVKIRGFRVELDEIEAVLLSHPSIKDAVVTAREDTDGLLQLIGYLVAEKTLAEENSEGQKLNVHDLKQFLATYLPDYMIPAKYVLLERLPVSPNGKIDRKALPEPTELLHSGAQYVAPRTEVEAKLIQIWSEVLGVKRVGIYDNFFELGGHSLKATTIIARVVRELQVNLPLRELFHTPTIAGLAEYICRAAKSGYISIPAVEPRPVYPLSSAQKRLFILYQMDPLSTSYNMPRMTVIDGEIDVERVRHTFALLFERHEALRTSFELIEGEPVQRIHTRVDWDLFDYGDDCAKGAEFVQPFDLHKAPLFRAAILKVEENKHLLMYDMHHIISDATSTAILLEEFLVLYEGLPDSDGTEIAAGPVQKIDEMFLPPLRIQYKDFAVWQNQQLASDEMEDHEAFWLQEFAGEVPILNLPTDFPRPAMLTFEGERCQFAADAGLAAGLHGLAAQHGATLYMVLLAAYSVLLSKYSGQEDLVIGSPVAGRVHADLERIIGVFVNTLAMRTRPEGEITFTDFLTVIREHALEAYKHQDYQFELLVEKLELQRNLNRNPLFDTMLVVQNVRDLRSMNPDTVTNQFEALSKVAKFDLTLSATEIGSEVHFVLDYSTQLFCQETVERMVVHFMKILSNVTTIPETRLAEIDMLTVEERFQLLETFNNTAADYPRQKTIHQLFEEIVDRYPDRIAVSLNTETMTYHELNTVANRLAARLRNKGVLPNLIVGMLVDRSLPMITGILAILKAGGAYLPIDPEYPEERIHFMLRDSEARWVLTEKDSNRSLLKKLQYDGEVLDIVEEIKTQVVDVEQGNTQSNAPDDLMYIIYTSGSTGQPKGVMIEHRNVVRLFFNDSVLFDFNEEDVWTMFHSYCFDFSVWEMYGALLYGGRLIMVPRLMAQNPAEFAQLLRTESVTVLNQTPTAFYHLQAEELKLSDAAACVRYIIFGGEVLKPRLLQDWQRKYPKTRLINMYGITETTVHVTYKEIFAQEMEENISNVGHPIPTLTTYIMDRSLHLVAQGVPGEICVGGNGVARGYLNRPELTKERFIQNPYKPDERLYRSGDLARWLPNGEIEYLGRIDQQVKIRGFRIELGEIESRLLDHPGITEAVVLARGEGEERYLCAYYVAPYDLPVTELHAFLQVKLPLYMLPAYYLRLDQLVLTSNGKVDHKALPEFHGQVNTGTIYAEPSTPIEEELVEIWFELLQVERIGINDDFFRLGGHSLKATQLAARVKAEFGVTLPLRTIFKHPTIREMALIIKDALLEGEEGSEIIPVSEHDWYPASSAQKRLYIVNQIDTSNTGYNMPGAIILSSMIDEDRIRTAFHALVERHESLRTSFELMDGEVVQRVSPVMEMDVPVWNVTEMEIPQILAQFVQPFDLQKAPLIRVGLIQCMDRPAMVPLNVILFDMHHIISDGISMEILTREFRQLYMGTYVWPLKLQYKDYAVWQNRFLQSERFKEQEAYWLNRFAGEIPVLQLPTDFSRPALRDFLGDRIYFTLSEDLTSQFKEMAKNQGATLYMTLLGVFQILLSKYSGQEEIIVGSPIAGRHHPGLEDVIGMFVNTLPMYNMVRGEETFSQFIADVKHHALNAYEHQDYPFEVLVEQLHLERSLSRNPLFDVMFALQTQSIVSGTGKSGLDELGQTRRIAKFDLTLNGSELEEGMMFTLEYATSLFQRETIERMAGHLLNIMETVVKNPDLRVADIELLTHREREQILVDFNDTQTNYPQNLTLDQLFAVQVACHADRPALVLGQRQMSYRELDVRSEELAEMLRSRGVGPDIIVALMAERSMEMIIAIFAILKAGGAYLPLNPTDPAERLQFMLRDSGTSYCLVQNSLQERLAWSGVTLPLENGFILVLKEGVKEQPVSRRSAANLAYVIYTSGTTGQPKGSLTRHYSVTRVVKETNYIEITPEDRILQLSNYAFDGSVFDIYGALLNGATLVLVDKDTILDPDRLAEVIHEQGITVFFITTALFNVLVDNNLESLCDVRKILFGGERISIEHARRAVQYLGPGKLIHVYGPTESTVFASYYHLNSIDEKMNSVPIGAPLANTQIYIVDQMNQLLPVGIPGELCIAGEGLALGYLNRTELTVEKFVHNPFAWSDTHEVMYRTGDLARWLPDGTIEFIGRIDQQVKIRGFRIEPGEIETQLLNHPAIQEAVVVVREIGMGGEQSTGEKVLCAYYVTNGKSAFVEHTTAVSAVKDREQQESYIDLTVAEVRNFLQERLPEYMIPTYCIPLEKMPLTRNGKVDYSKLPAPNQRVIKQADYTAPGNELEANLSHIWASILNLEQISIHDDFFALGGHSLKVITVMKMINTELGTDYPVSMLFMHPTIAELATALSHTLLHGSSRSEENGRMEPRNLECIVHLRVGEPGKHLFLLHPLGGSIHWYKALTDLFEEDYNIYGIQARGLLKEGPLPKTLEQMAAEYIAEIREIQPTGPYYFGAYCAGSIIAYEMIRQLEDGAEEPGACILIDSPAFRSGGRTGSRVYALQRSLRKLQTEMNKGVQTLVSRVQGLLGRESDDSAVVESQVNARQIEIEENIVRVLSRYRPERRIRANLHLLKAIDNPDPRISGDLWNELTEGTVQVVLAPGDHFSILEEPRVRETAARIRELIRR